ncbi:aromatic-L-amino-acid decarboxylase-like [Physella acuta]|uniref:aromatic-L-amino-acid decarboxylase-like n=1 Tax=Physella acuta TaxID=109671 RepID=UPI0027DC3C1B|nr:aromatic-L-amino-acid decarboxylase-like [Physella acuta]
MDTHDFKRRGSQVMDFIADYIGNIRSRRVLPDVKKGYLRKLLPDAAPENGEKWESIMADFEKSIMPGIVHWQHPNFHAYLPLGYSFTSVLADTLADGLGVVAFSWASSPAAVELELLLMDWVGKMIGLPDHFMNSSGQGGGCIQGSASECVLVALLSARHRTIQGLKSTHPHMEDGELLTKLVAYSSKLAHSSVEKAGLIGLVKLRQLEHDENYSLRGDVLEEAMQEDIKRGLVPFFVCASLGTTTCCSFDNLQEVGEVCTRRGVYLHVDAAYAGGAFVCPEFQHFLNGVENVDSFSMNPYKLLQVNVDGSMMWVKNAKTLTSSLTVDPLYLRTKHEDEDLDIRHWGIPLSRRFRALKVWFVIRTYGLKGLQARIREHVRLGKFFESKVLADDRFEVVAQVTLGLVCFRLRNTNELNERLMERVNKSGMVHMVPGMLNDKYILRLAVCTPRTTEDDISFAWDVIRSTAGELLKKRPRLDSTQRSGSLLETVSKRRPTFCSNNSIPVEITTQIKARPNIVVENDKDHQDFSPNGGKYEAESDDHFDEEMTSFSHGIRGVFSKYAETASMNGVNMINAASSLTVKLVWGLLLAATFGVMTFHLYMLIDKYYLYKTNTKVELGFSELPFPAVTICNVNIMRLSQQKFANQKIRDIIGNASFDQLLAKENAKLASKDGGGNGGSTDG